MGGHDSLAMQATEGLGYPADGRVLGALVTEVADKLQLARPLLLAHSVGSQVCGSPMHADWWRFTCVCEAPPLARRSLPA